MSLNATARIYRNLLALLCLGVQLVCAHPYVVGYYPAWLRSVLPASQIQWQSVTHIIQAFAWPQADGTIGRYSDLLYPELVNRAHDAGVKVLVAFGGWGQSDGFAPMVANPQARTAFIEGVINFCESNGFDGVDIDWEYPSNSADRSNLNALIQELRQAFVAREKEWLITIAVPTGDWAGQWFDYATLQNYVDWIGCMTYDFMGSWVNIATHNAPLYSHPHNPQGSVHASIQYLTATRKISPSRILLGIPFYGRGCNATGLFQPNTGGNCEYYYAQIMPKIGSGWNYYWDEISQAPYLLNVSQTQFITFDDTQSVRLKCEYVRATNLGGVMIWALGQDKINASQPLLTIIAAQLRSGVEVKSPPRRSSEAEVILNCYPNPSNERITIAFYIPQEDIIRLEICDLRGYALATILNRREAPGWHRVNLGADSFATGLYLYRLSSSNYSKTGKVLTIK